MSEYVLSIYAQGDACEGAPMRLTEVGVDEPLATHQTGFNTAPFVRNGIEVDPAGSLTGPGLMDIAGTQFAGEELWRRLAPGDIGTTITPLLKNSRIYLDFRSAKVAKYPWELLRLSAWFLFLKGKISLGRPTQVPGLFAGTPPPPDHPLRVLVVLGNGPLDDKIKANEELIAIESQAHTKNDEVLLRTLIRPDPGQIEATLLDFQPHVFHFIGHGFQPSADSEPEIHVFGASSDQNDPWRADRIRAVFSQSPPGLVVLNACLTAGGPTGSAPLVQAFHDAGCIAVVSMMGEIRADASHELSKRFYRELLDGQPVDSALASARLALKELSDGRANQNVAAMRSNWPLPRLTVQGDVAGAVTVTSAALPSNHRWLKDDFVVRWDERWRVWKSMDGTYSRLAVLSGDTGVGKSELLNTVAETCARHGETVIVVDVGGPNTSDTWRDVLLAIADETADAELTASGLADIAMEPGESRQVIKKFRTELENCAAPGGLLIVLDGLSDWLTDLVRETLLPELCGPYLVATGTSGVRMMITMKDDCRDAWLARPARWQPIEIGQFSLDEWERAVTHLAAHWVERVAEGNVDNFKTIAESFRISGQRNGSTLHLVRGTAKTMLRR